MIFYHVYITVYPNIVWWAPGFIWKLSYCELSCYKLESTDNSFICTFHFFEYIPRSRMAHSFGRSIFRFLRNLSTIFHNGYTTVHSNQQWFRVPIFSNSLKMFVIFSLLLESHSCWNEWACIVVFTQISVMRSWDLFMCLLVICILSLVNVLCPFLNWIILLFLSFLSSLWQSFISCLVCKHFLHSVCCFFLLYWGISFVEVPYLEIIPFVFAFIACTSVVLT